MPPPTMTATQHAPTAADPSARSANPVRRSISIFSRRGPESPAGPTPETSWNSAREATPSPRHMSERQKQWVAQRDTAAAVSTRFTSAKPNHMPVHHTKHEDRSSTTTPSSRSRPHTTPRRTRSKSAASLPRTLSQRRRDAISRIGTWVDGVHSALDDDDALLSDDDSDIRDVIASIRARPVSCGLPVAASLSPPSPTPPSSYRPHLSLFISRDTLSLHTRSASDVSQSSRKPPSLTAIVALTSKFSAAAAKSRPPIHVNGVEELVVPGEFGTLDVCTRVPSQGPPPSKQHHLHSRPPRSSTSSRSMTDEDSSHSNHSSVTSVEMFTALGPPFSTSRYNNTPVTHAPRGASDDDDDDISPRSSVSVANVNKPLPPTPIPVPRTSISAPPRSKRRIVPMSAEACTLLQVASLPPHPSGTMPTPTHAPEYCARVPDPPKRQQVRQSRKTQPTPHLERCPVDWEQPAQDSSRAGAPSPTLSQAENDLQSQLSSMGTVRSSVGAAVNDETNELQPLRRATGKLKRRDSAKDVVQPPCRVPTLPKRSRKREWRISHFAVTGPLRRKSESHRFVNKNGTISLPLRKMKSVPHMSNRFANMVRLPRVQVDGDADGGGRIDGPRDTDWEDFESPAVASGSAEKVLLSILSRLPSISDLCRTAMVSKGMYQIFKENDIGLLRAVLYNQSPAAWELREWSSPVQHDLLTGEEVSYISYSAATYMLAYRRDLDVIERLKRLIHEKCATFIRRESTFALSTPTHPNSQRFSDAFWRIWCFCKIFGCGKGREEDITGQIDWLKGGLVAHARGCVATVTTNLEFELGSILLNAPDHFAKANAGGLSAIQLYDMTEMWNCLTFLLHHDYSGRIEQAREHGVFSHCGVVAGDVVREEQLLEEWLAHILTLGPDVVLHMALSAADNGSAAGFALAQKSGLTDWTPPVYNGSRGRFLSEPLGLCYEEQISAATLGCQDPGEQEEKERSRKRTASMAAAIRLRQQSSEYKNLPLIGMEAERAMSVASRASSVASARSTRTSYSDWNLSPMSSYGRASARPSTFSPSSVSTPWCAQRSISPIAEDGSTDGLVRMSLDGIANDTSEVAVGKLVSMGFSPPRARDALRFTDSGEGLRIDRAVEYLLRQH